MARRKVDPIKVLDDIEATVKQLRTVRNRIAKLNVEKTELETTIKDALGEASEGTIQGHTVVTWHTSIRQVLDQKLLRERYPRQAAACTSEQSVRSFTVKDPAP